MKILREGVTTGTCATAAAMASALWQMEGRCPVSVTVDTPAGRKINLEIVQGNYPLCSVIKDAGDDPDVTNGCLVQASVEILRDNGEITFKGGQGIGTVTAPGLKLPVGEPAINPVPRQMIREHLKKVIGDKGAVVTVSVPNGEQLAKKTFNPRLGIVGGISILGTSGIVRPMSEEAMKDSLSVELGFRLTSVKHVAFVLGQTGEHALHQLYGEHIACVQISNYIGYMLDEAVRMGAESILVAGFAGKLVKVAADVMNTHSHVADARRETVCTYAALHGADRQVIRALFDCKTVQKTIDIVRENHLEEIWNEIADAACEKCRLRTGNAIQIGMILLDSQAQILGCSKNAMEVLAACSKK